MFRRHKNNDNNNDELSRPEIREKLEKMKEAETDKFRKAAILVLLVPSDDAGEIIKIPEVIELSENEDPNFAKLAYTIREIRRELGI